MKSIQTLETKILLDLEVESYLSYVIYLKQI